MPYCILFNKREIHRKWVTIEVEHIWSQLPELALLIRVIEIYVVSPNILISFSTYPYYTGFSRVRDTHAEVTGFEPATGWIPCHLSKMVL